MRPVERRQDAVFLSFDEAHVMLKLIRIKYFGLRMFPLVACLGVLACTGCERKERVVDVKTPSTTVTVDRGVESGKVEVNAERK
jgi:hypothetical protein